MPPIKLFVLDAIPSGPENHLTHFFFGVLSHLVEKDPSVLEKFFATVDITIPSSWGITSQDFIIEEQVHTFAGIFDSVIRAQKKFQIIIESKVDAPLEREQIKRYYEAAKTQREDYPHYKILAITPRPNDENKIKDLQYVKHVTWEQLFSFMANLQPPIESVVLRDQLLDLMRGRGMEPMKLNLDKAEDIKLAIALVDRTRQQIESFLGKVASHVNFKRIKWIDDWDEWFLKVKEDKKGNRTCFKIMDLRHYPYDSDIRFDVIGRRVKFTLYLVVRGWNTQRPQPDEDYYKKAIRALVALKQTVTTSDLLKYKISIYDWQQKEPYWSEPLDQLDLLIQRQEEIAHKWRTNMRSEITIETELDLTKVNPSFNENTIVLTPEEFDKLGKNVAERFNAFIDSLAIIRHALDHA